jgi:hypothetical protein
MPYRRDAAPEAPVVPVRPNVVIGVTPSGIWTGVVISLPLLLALSYVAAGVATEVGGDPIDQLAWHLTWSMPAGGVLWLGVIALGIRVARDPGFVFGPDAVRAPLAMTAWLRAAPVRYADIDEIELKLSRPEIVAGPRRLVLSTKGVGEWQRDRVIHELVDRIAHAKYARGEVPAAIAWLKRTEPEHPDLAEWYQQIGDREEARRRFRHLHQGALKKYGPDDPRTITAKERRERASRR